jgi:cysteinyl-tRNA synthetase
LNVRPPDVLPRATEVIPEIHQAVSQLLERGVAYASQGSVYFDIDTWPAYGRLSRFDRDEMLRTANERGNDALDPRKRHPLDFVLWQAAKPGEPAWRSPWGLGRPGWHIECSTLSRRFLGETVDIHGGGTDLIFPHHESEIAQMEAITGHAFVRYWMHAAMVRHAGEKMSKSLGNLVLIDALLQRYSPDTLRVLLASHHYREVWEFDEAELARAGATAARLREASRPAAMPGMEADADPWVERFRRAMDDDLNTPAALAAVVDLADRILARAVGNGAQVVLRRLGSILGLRSDSEAPEERVGLGWESLRRTFATSGVPPVADRA